MAVERLLAKDYEDFLDFIDQVFSQDLIRVHFQEDLPLLFKPDDEHMQMQYAYRDEKGRFRAAIGCIPYTYKIGDEEFKTWTITNVATHYRYTGRGYMRTIFKKVFEDMKAEGVDFAILHGNRERYRHTGFEPAGQTDNAGFESYNIPNRRKRGEVYDFTFEEVKEGDTERIRQCLELFNREGQHYVRAEENYLDFQHMWEGKCYVVLDNQGQFCGSLNLCTRFGTVIRELFLTCPKDAARVIYSFMLAQGLEHVMVHVSPFDKELNRAIYEAAEYVSAGQTTRMNLLRPERFLQAALELKRSSGAYMPEGKIVIQSSFGRLLIQNDGKFTVRFTDEPADFEVPGGEIYSLLFGPAPTVYNPYSKELGEKAVWFPAPFYIHNTDLY